MQMLPDEPLLEPPQTQHLSVVDAQLCSKLCIAPPKEVPASASKADALAAALAGVEGCAVTGDTRPGILEYHSAYLSVLLPSHC